MSIGRSLLTVSALWAGVGSYVFDWNETHIHNPAWPPHAKFHNAQTMSLGVGLAAATAGALWSGPMTRGRLAAGATAASLYWVTQLSAPFYPGTALRDEPEPPPRFKGPQTVIASAALAINAVACALELRRAWSPTRTGDPVSRWPRE